MPVVVRDSGKMWNKDNALEDVKCLIPDRCYSTMYEACLQDCRANGQYDVATMGNVSNVGLMAQKVRSAVTIVTVVTAVTSSKPG
eukprot:3524072-Prymnesium_polylepis.1